METTPAHPNAALFRKGYEAFQAGDMDAVRELFHPDLVWHAGGHNHTSGDYRGADATLGSFLQLMQESNGTFRNELHAVLGDDEHAVALATVRAEKDGKSLEQRYVHVIHVKDGKLTESWIFPEDQAETDAFWG